MKRVLVNAAVAAALVLVGAGSAQAAMSGSLRNLGTTGASMTGNTYRFDPWPCNSSCVESKWSGFTYWGTLQDTKTDGHQVFVHAHPDGYGWATRIYTGGTRSIGQKVYAGADPAQTGYVQICRDRGTLLPDNCDTTSKTRHS